MLQNAHNVLVASSPVARHGLVAKVADLGLSRVLKQQATHRTTSTVGVSLGAGRTFNVQGGVGLCSACLSVVPEVVSCLLLDIGLVWHDSAVIKPCIVMDVLAARLNRSTPHGQYGSACLICCPAFAVHVQVGMLTHQPPELLQDGRMSPAVDIYRWAPDVVQCRSCFECQLSLLWQQQQQQQQLASMLQDISNFQTSRRPQWSQLQTAFEHNLEIPVLIL
jgi:hypothetical protein